jgi:tetratricopeptide (TPR) repeat protein
MRSICSIACILLAALGFALQPAACKARQRVAAEATVSPESRTACLDDKVAECTLLIDSGQVSGADLVRAHLRRGLMYALFAGDCERGIADFSEMVRLDERNATGFALRGSCQISTSDLDRALADLNRAHQLNPKEFNVHNGFGRYCKGDLVKALADFRQALNVNSDKRQRPVRMLSKGSSGSTPAKPPPMPSEPPFSTNLDRALADLNESKRLNPNSGTVHNVFGLYYNAIGALVEFNESLRLFSQYLYAYKNHALTYEHKGELAVSHRAQNGPDKEGDRRQGGRGRHRAHRSAACNRPEHRGFRGSAAFNCTRARPARRAGDRQR